MVVSHSPRLQRVLLGYGSAKNDIVLLGTGTGGLEEVREQLRDDKIQFAVLEVTGKHSSSTYPEPFFLQSLGIITIR